MSIQGCIIKEKDGSDTMWDALGSICVKTNLLMLHTSILYRGELTEYISHKNREQAIQFHDMIASCLHWPIQENFTIH